MKTLRTFPALIVLSGIILSCEKHNEVVSDTLNLTGIKSGSKTEIVNIKLKSSKTSFNPVECFVMGSSVFIPGNNGFGYVDCYSNFHLINPETGDTIKSFDLPGMVSHTAVDVTNNMLIGIYYQDDSNHLLKMNLETGAIVADNDLKLNPGIFACSYFYRPSENRYVLIRADSVMLSINPDNGEIMDSAALTVVPNNIVYNREDDIMIGLSYSIETGKNSILTLDATSGELLSEKTILGPFDYYACVSGYDNESRCYIIVTSENKILFIDIGTGEIKDSYKVDFPIIEFEFWHSK